MGYSLINSNAAATAMEKAMENLIQAYQQALKDGNTARAARLWVIMTGITK